MGIPIILDPAPAASLSKDIYTSIHTITPNETELRSLTGEDDIERGAEKLLSLGVKEVIVTLGERGCYYTDGSLSTYIDAFTVDAIDTTAAGDSFNGAYAVALVEGQSKIDALKFANAVGSLTTTKLGAYDALPLRDGVEKFLKR